jgi:DNA-directed RNA polymerase subunit M/transcription elongation factor TFIIS
MQFCPNCENILYSSEIDSELYDKCIQCDYHVKAKNHIIETMHYRENRDEVCATKKNNIYAHVYSRTIHVPCPNTECPSKTENSLQEAMIIQDPKTLRVTYMCVPCGNEWTI